MSYKILLTPDFNCYIIQSGDEKFMTQKINRTLPLNVIARWKAEDWNDETMTASEYSYEDAETREPLKLTEEEAGRYTWGTCQDDLTGGSQGGELRDAEDEAED